MDPRPRPRVRGDMRKLIVLALLLASVAAHADPDRPTLYQVADDLLLAPTDGTYELALPTVVGPRYRDEQAIDPPVAAPGLDTGNTFDVDLDVDAGVPIGSIDSPTHSILATKVDEHHYQIAL